MGGTPGSASCAASITCETSQTPPSGLRPLRPEEATRNRYAIRGYISAAAKHDAGILTALRDVLAGNPWMPPVPAQA